MGAARTGLISGSIAGVLAVLLLVSAPVGALAAPPPHAAVPGTVHTIALGPAGANPTSLAVDPATGDLLVGLLPAYVDVISPTTGAVLDTIDLGTNATPAALVVDPLNEYLYVATTTGSLIAVSLSNDSLVAELQGTGSGASGIAYDAYDGNLYISDFGSSDIWVVDPAYPATVAYIQFGADNPQAIAYDPTYDAIIVGGENPNLGIAYVSAFRVDSLVWTWSGGYHESSNGAGLAINDSSGEIYFTSNPSNQILEISQFSELTGTVTIGSAPSDVAFGNGTLLATSPEAGSVTEVGAANLTIRAGAQIGGFPTNVVYDPTTGEFAVLNSLANTLSLVRPGDLAVEHVTLLSRSPATLVDERETGTVVVGGADLVEAIPSGTGPVTNGSSVGRNTGGIAYDPTSGELYVTNGYDDTVSVLYASNLTLRTTLDVCVQGGGISFTGFPVGIVYDPVSGEVYVACQYDNVVDMLNGSNGEVDGVIPVGNGPIGLAVDTTNGDLLVCNFFDNTVDLVSGSNVLVDWILPSGAEPVAATFDPNASTFFIAEQGFGSVIVLNATDFVSPGTVVVGPDPSALAFDPLTNEVFVALTSSATVVELNATTRAALAQIPVGAGPAALAFNAANQQIYVANQYSDSVSYFAPVPPGSPGTPAAGTLGIPTSDILYTGVGIAGAAAVAVGLVLVRRRPPKTQRPQNYRVSSVDGPPL